MSQAELRAVEMMAQIGALVSRAEQAEFERDAARANRLAADNECASTMSDMRRLRAKLDAAEAEIARLNGTVEHLRAFCLNPHEHEYGICEACNGIGSRMYSNTSTWRQGCGGSAMTTGVCNKCWGSGSQDRPWPSWRAIEGDRANAHRLSEELTALRACIAEVTELTDTLKLPRAKAYGLVRASLVAIIAKHGGDNV